MKRFLVIVALVLLASAVMLSPVDAKKGGQGKGKGFTEQATASISIDQADVRLGDGVTFTTVAGGLAGWEHPMVAVWCYQDDVLVYMELATPDSALVLGGDSSDWRVSGGAADCEAYLYAYGWKGGRESIRTLAGTSFEAGA